MSFRQACVTQPFWFWSSLSSHCWGPPAFVKKCLTIAGLTFDELKGHLTETKNQQVIVIKASITMGTLRSIQVFVFGEAFPAGAYTVSAVSTMINALFVSGGVKKISSLLRIQLKRNGEHISELYLYDLNLEGDTSSDTRLLPGDVIFVFSVGKMVGVSGEVGRPAIYELNGEKNAGELIKLAVGFLPTAYPKATRVNRVNERGDRTDLSGKQWQSLTLQDSGIIQVFPVLDKVEVVAC